MKAGRQSVSAEALALQALAFVLAEDHRLQRFLWETGASADAIRAAPDDPVLLGAVLDFLMAFDDRLLAFASHAAVDPAHIAAARRALPGGPAAET